MNNNNNFVEISVKQQLALSHIGRDLLAIDKQIKACNANSKQRQTNNYMPKWLSVIIKYLNLER